METLKIFIRSCSISVVLILVSAFALPCGVPAHAKGVLPVLRLSGADRYQTAVAISREGWTSPEAVNKEGWISSEFIVLASGEGDDKFADALAGSPAAYMLEAPMLLTAVNQLNASTLEEIKRLKTKKAVLLGGTGVISDNVEKQLNDMNIQTERLWGPDRYWTAVKIGERVRTTRTSSKVFLTTGEKFQYAMMIAPYASKNGIPILFTGKDSLNPVSAEAIGKWDISEVDIIGSTDIISQAVEDNLLMMGIKVNRTSGTNLADTNINIINTYKMGTSKIAAARDDLFADGLAGTSFAALKDMNIILTGQNEASPVISQYLHSCNLEYSYVFGGAGAVSDYIITLMRKGVSDYLIPGNTAGNINSGGLAAINDGWIYYHNAKDEGKLYKIKTDGTGKEEVCSDSPLSINVVGDWIYYENISDNMKIYKIRKDGTCRTKINDDESWHATVMDNWIYYTNEVDGGHMYKIGVDGACREKLNDYSSRYVNVKWDWIYHVNADEGRAIYRIKQNDSEAQLQMLEGVNAWGINILGDFIYFTNENDNHRLYKINLDGTGLTKLCDDTVYDIQVVEDWIYFSNSNDDSKLYKIKTDGTNKTKIYDGTACLINIVGDWIYFSNDEEGLLLYKIKTDGTGFAEVE